jgi:hypothetical protein
VRFAVHPAFAGFTPQMPARRMPGAFFNSPTIFIFSDPAYFFTLTNEPYNIKGMAHEVRLRQRISHCVENGNDRNLLPFNILDRLPPFSL